MYLRSSSSDVLLSTWLNGLGNESVVPPGLKPLGVLAEVLVHAGDISEGVGRPLAFPTDHYVAGLDFLKDMQP